MAKRAREPAGREHPQQQHPPLVERPEQRQRRVDRRRPRLRQLGPAGLLVRLDGGGVLGQRELETGVSIQVTVRHMMDHLTDGPASFAVRRIQLGVVEPAHGLANLAGKRRNLIDERGPFGVGKGGRGLELPDGIAQVGHRWSPERGGVGKATPTGSETLGFTQRPPGPAMLRMVHASVCRSSTTRASIARTLGTPSADSVRVAPRTRAVARSPSTVMSPTFQIVRMWPPAVNSESRYATWASGIEGNARRASSTLPASRADA